MQLRGTATELYDLYEENELDELLAYAIREQRQLIPIGEGSNLVFPVQLDACWVRILVDGIEIIESCEKTATIRVGAGVNWHSFVQFCATNGYHGLENLALIPGSVGAAPIQNIGAYGIEVGDAIARVNGVYLPGASGTNACEGSFSLANSECRFAYRDSIFKQELKDRTIITSVEFTLSTEFSPNLDYPVLRKIIDEKGLTNTFTAVNLVDTIVEIRQSRLPDPAVQANAGSFFKNPFVTEKIANRILEEFPDAPCFKVSNERDDKATYKLSAAWLIEKSGLKGFSSGLLAMSAQHALVLVHTPEKNRRADAHDVVEFADYIQTQVFNRFGARLEIEPRVIL